MVRDRDDGGYSPSRLRFLHHNRVPVSVRGLPTSSSPHLLRRSSTVPETSLSLLIPDCHPFLYGWMTYPLLCHRRSIALLIPVRLSISAKLIRSSQSLILSSSCARISPRAFSLTIFPPSACWLIVFKSMDYWWHEKWPSLFSMLFWAIGFGSDLVYRVVIGWCFGPVPNNGF